MYSRATRTLFLCALAAFLIPGGWLHAAPHPGDGGRRGEKAAAFREEVTTLYDQTDLKEMGLSRKALEYALKGYYYLLEHHRLARTNILSICDLSQSSRNKRLYVVDLEQKKVVINTYVAHGRNSGQEYARTFSNNPRSHKSSLGFYVTEGTYQGNNGISLKIHGQERGFNDRADGRNIVIHGSEYVGSDYLRMNSFTGRSFGCPAVPADEIDTVIDTIKEGSCLFIYHPTTKYISRSKILNS
ncbi:MAG TPA: murein L,D-transpeptidase catalytic domain family protein [Puia sp.]|nr:murein L,D-transpeptidase catalytic domain family protein [Puia sp.]